MPLKHLIDVEILHTMCQHSQNDLDESETTTILQLQSNTLVKESLLKAHTRIEKIDVDA